MMMSRLVFVAAVLAVLAAAAIPVFASGPGPEADPAEWSNWKLDRSYERLEVELPPEFPAGCVLHRGTGGQLFLGCLAEKILAKHKEIGIAE